LKYSRCWNDEGVKLYFTTESREKQKEVFERTHLPIQKIGVSFSKDIPIGKKFITEEELKNLVINSVPEDQNRIFLVVGETGCGKSELCQWLEYNIADGIHIPLHISRSDTKIQDIARILNSHLPKEAQEVSEVSELIYVRSDLLAKYLVAELQLEFSRDKSIKHPWDRRNLERLFEDYTFKDKLNRDIQKYQQGLIDRNKERGLLVLSRKSFEFFPIVKHLKDKETAYFFTNRTITRALKEKLKVGNIGKQLQQIAEHYVKMKKRPVLLLEDLTSFSFLAEDLMDYLFDLSKGHFDVVIGWTTGFEKGHADFIFRSPDTLTYMKERFRARFILTDENDKSTFFLQDSYKELAKKYLLAVKCGKCSRCKEDKEGLYPFNATSLDKIYANLQEDGHPKQTPRLFLEFVIRKVLQSHQEPPWKVLSSTSLYLKESPSLIGQKYREHPDFVECLKWYGNEKERNVELDTRIIKWFNIESPIPIDEEKVTIPMSQIGIAIQKGKIKPEQKGKTTAEEDIVDFQSWLNGKGDNFLTRDALRKGVVEQIQLVQNPCELRNPRSSIPRTTSLFYQRGSLSIPVFIEDSRDDPLQKDYKLIVTREDPPEMLEQLYYAGQGGKIADEYLCSVLEWAKTKSKKYNNQLCNILSEALGIKLEGFILFSKFLITNLEGKCVRPEIFQMKNTEETYFTATNLRDAVLNAKTQRLLEKRNEIQSIFASFFYITKSFFDFLEFDEIVRKMDIYKTLKQVAKIDCRRIRDAYKIGSSKQQVPFRELVGIVRNYAYALEQFAFEDQFNELKGRLIKVLHLIPMGDKINELPTKIENIKKACSMLQIPLEQSWIQSFDAIKRQNIDFQSLKEAIKSIIEKFAECKNVFQFVQFVREYDNSSSTEEYKTISDLLAIAYLVNRKAQDFEVVEESPSANNIQRVKTIYEKLSEHTEKFT